jgi:hypothetical protein
MAIEWGIDVALHAAFGVPVGFTMAGKTNAGDRAHGLLRNWVCRRLFGDFNCIEIKSLLL